MTRQTSDVYQSRKIGAKLMMSYFHASDVFKNFEGGRKKKDKGKVSKGNLFENFLAHSYGNISMEIDLLCKTIPSNF